MIEQTYTLSELARLARKSKMHLKEMIDGSELRATQETTGRCSWIIRHEDAVAAGLLEDSAPKPQPLPEGSVDAAVAAIVERSIAPLGEALRDIVESIQAMFADSGAEASRPTEADKQDQAPSAPLPDEMTLDEPSSLAPPARKHFSLELVVAALSLVTSLSTLVAVVLR